MAFEVVSPCWRAEVVVTPDSFASGSMSPRREAHTRTRNVLCRGAVHVPCPDTRSHIIPPTHPARMPWEAEEVRLCETACQRTRPIGLGHKHPNQRGHISPNVHPFSPHPLDHTVSVRHPTRSSPIVPPLLLASSKLFLSAAGTSLKL